jgi:hypothetical protein
MLCEHVKLVCAYAKNLPGFDRFCLQDKAKIIKNRIFSMQNLRITHLIVDDECYLMSPDSIQLTIKLSGKAVGTNEAEQILKYHNRLNSLNLTNYEMAVLCSMILSMPLAGYFS